MKDERKSDQKLSAENGNQKKNYEVPQFFRHEPLESVSTTYYYYYYS